MLHTEIIAVCSQNLTKGVYTLQVACTTFNGNRYHYHCGLMMNLLQPSGYCACRQGAKTCPSFARKFHLCIPYASYNQQQISPIQYSLTVLLIKEHCILCEEYNVSFIAHRNQQLHCTESLRLLHLSWLQCSVRRQKTRSVLNKSVCVTYIYVGFHGVTTRLSASLPRLKKPNHLALSYVMWDTLSETYSQNTF
jgi:hypothetical protein